MTEWWHELSLAELNPQQWEELCDGCGRCCLHKLEDEDSGEVFYTRVHCRFLDAATCRCSDYRKRSQLVPECITLVPDMVGDLDWLPSTCAYRLRARGERLPDWHHLVSGSRETVHSAGISIRGRTLPEQNVHPDSYEELIVTWVE
ncbi:YcgN family cysteine cluster protein [Haliea sp. E17]|uniref:YcgN family cysteine cluster protein n=1 Tax=Haliea sp. E17 TaxID=3401576 RepID=UPI003AADC4F5